MKILFCLLACPFLTYAATESVENKLKNLSSHETSALELKEEKLYSVQSRSFPLSHKTEIQVSWAQNLGGSGFLKTQMYSVGAHYHFTDRFSLALGYGRVVNEFNQAAERLEQVEGLLPDVDFAQSRLEMRAEYSLFYGKFRFTSDQIYYFDQYWGAGVAQHELKSGNVTGPVLDAGFAFWFAPMSLRLGLKDYYYKESRRLSSGEYHNVHGYAEVGYVF